MRTDYIDSTSFLINQRVESHGQEEGTYWIYLRSGWIMPSGEHAIAEDTKAQALRRLDEAIPCRCAECMAPEVAHKEA